MKKCRGFTLIELLIIITIIGVLSAVVIGAIERNSEKQNDVTEVKPQPKSNTETIKNTFEEVKQIEENKWKQSEYNKDSYILILDKYIYILKYKDRYYIVNANGGIIQIDRGGT